MFTGLIQEIGRVKKLDLQGDSARLSVSADMVRDDLQMGESIAVCGACLTVVSWDTSCFTVDVSPETLQLTTIGALRPQQPVNLERALRLCDRLGGHLVSGHIDCVGRVLMRSQDANAVRFRIALPVDAMRYVVAKGSVAIEGISLTVNAVGADFFEIAIIPHSLEMTTLQFCREGTEVNIETDLIGRYVERLFPGGEREQTVTSGIDLDLLAKNGFL
jgi:riboflavin synthase